MFRSGQRVHSRKSPMKLPVPFIQLPLMFDAQALAAEIAGFDESLWQPHPNGLPGNSALPLVTVEGDPARGDDLEGPMRPTPTLQNSPYMQQVLGSLAAVIGRTRLMRLSGRAEVDLHVDSDYYWNERVRVHVPILTQPTVRFTSGDATINMAAGECWIFDTWRMHHVLNDADLPRVHLVVDTVGGAAFWDLVNAGRPHAAPNAGWQPRFVAPQPDAPPPLAFESVNSQSPMSYWELRGHITFLLNEAAPDPRMNLVAQIAGVFVRRWQTLWFQYGTDAAAMPRYRDELDEFMARIAPAARGVVLRNGADFVSAVQGLFRRAVRRPQAVKLGEEGARSAPATAVRAAPRHTFEFERPVFIVSPPRSGSSLFFETLARSPDAFTIGGESHGLIEGIAALDTGGRGHASNRLDADDAGAEVVAELRERFRGAMFDRQGRAPSGTHVRLLEKTPKNALRIPFLANVFPDAMFVYLYRDPRQVLASMMEAWESGGFRTYPNLPGWSGLPWSLLLVPGWRELVGKPLPEIVAAQWETTTRILLDDLESLVPERWCVARYDALVDDPNREIARVCAAVGFGWDQTLDARLPLANHTVSAPRADKWRQREADIAPMLERMAATVDRASRVAQR